MPNAQRALWTFLFYALVAPFFAALAVVILVALAPLVGFAGSLPEGAQNLGMAALSTFVWSAAPAVVTGLVCAAIVYRTGTLGWFAAALVAIVVFSISTELLAFGVRDLRPFLTPLAGVIGVAVRQVLARASIIPD